MITPSFLTVTLPSAAMIGMAAPGSWESWEKKTGWLSCHFFSIFPGRCITAAVYALARAMSGVSGLAPSERRMVTGNPPAVHDGDAHGLPERPGALDDGVGDRIGGVEAEAAHADSFGLVMLIPSVR